MDRSQDAASPSMIRCLRLTIRSKLFRKDEDRLFVMNDRQAEAYTRAVHIAEKAPGFNYDKAIGLAQEVVTKLLLGAPVPEDVHGMIVKLRMVFPILTPEDIRRLPIRGCRSMRMPGILIVISNGDETRIVRYDFDSEQEYAVACYLNAHPRQADRDYAWCRLSLIIPELLNGGSTPAGLPACIAVLLDDAFNEEQGMLDRLPLATELDVRELYYRDPD